MIIPYLKASGITKIDFLILTHGDYDHMGDAITLIEKFKIENVIFNVGDYNELESRIIKKLKKKNIPYYQNVEYLNFGQMKLNFLNTKIYDNENFQGYFVVDSFQLNVNLNWIPSLTMKRIPVQYGNITTYLPEEWEVLLIKRYGADWKENPILERKMKFNFIFDDYIKH